VSLLFEGREQVHGAGSGHRDWHSPGAGDMAPRGSVALLTAAAGRLRMEQQPQTYRDTHGINGISGDSQFYGHSPLISY
jgi:hypothetical protein